MTTIQLYHKHKAGEVSREKFLYEVRRDSNLPWVTNVTSYDDAVKILKNKGIISELEKPTKIYQDQEDQWEVDFISDLKASMADPSQAEEILAKAKESMKDHGETLKGMYKMFARSVAPRAFLSDFAPDQLKETTNEAKGSINDPGLMAARAKKDQAKKKKEEPKSDKNKAKIDALIKQKKEIEREMENDPEVEKEGGKKADEYGDKLDKIDAKIKKLRQLNEADANVDTEGTYDIILRNGEIYKKNVKFHKNGEWYIETPSSYAGGKMPDGATVKKSTESLKEADANVDTDPAVDRVNPYFLKRGVQKILAKEKELTNDSYINALNKAAKQLEKNPHAFDEDMLANAKDVEKADSKLETQEVKKANHLDKANEMKKVKVKSLKETILDELANSLKKKELVSEDIHWKHTVGSEVYTPKGPGKVVEIVGSTLTVEMEDGTEQDWQINVVDKATQDAAEKEKSGWEKFDARVRSGDIKPFQGMLTSPDYWNRPLDYSKLKEFIDKNKGDKEKLHKLKKAIKERLDIVKGRNVATGEDEVLAVVPGGQGSKVAQNYKSKGASSTSIKSIA